MPTPIQLSLPWRGRNSRPTASTVKWRDHNINPLLRKRGRSSHSDLCPEVGAVSPLERSTDGNLSFEDYVSTLWYQQEDYLRESNCVARGEDAPETRSFSTLGVLPNVMDYRVGNTTSTDVPDVPVTPSILRLSAKLPARAATSPSSGPSVEYEENKSSPYAKSKKRTTFKEARMETQAISDFQAQLRASYGPSGSSAAQDSKAAQKSTIKVGRIAAGSTGAAAQLPPPVPLPAPGSFENRGLLPRSVSFEGLDTTSSTTVNERLPPPGSPTLMLHTPLSTAGSPARGTAEELGDDLEALLSRASEQSDGAHTCT